MQADGIHVYSLSIHADYACAHSGACCTAGWPIPVELDTFERLRGMFPAVKFVAAAGAPPHTPVVAGTRDDGTCVFYERDSGLCAIHRRAGLALLPVACRQFPRVSLLDGRGLFVNLSHYCPTAAGLLFRADVPLTIVESPAAFPAGFDYDPLDARNDMPPLLHPGVMLDLGTFDRWEREVVAIFGRAELSAEAALELVMRLTEALREWKPGRGSLAAYFGQVRERTLSHGPSNQPRPAARNFGAVMHLVAAIPAGLRPELRLDGIEEAYASWVEPSWAAFAAPVRRYLAAKAFGSWLAYQAPGLATIVRSVAVALSTLKVNAALECASRSAPLTRERLVAAIRRTDELLVHLASPDSLAHILGGLDARPRPPVERDRL